MHPQPFCALNILSSHDEFLLWLDIVSSDSLDLPLLNAEELAAEAVSEPEPAPEEDSAEAPAPEPAVAVAEEAPADDRPKKRGWWSMG